MIMDTLGALALATEPPNDEMMRRPPVTRGADFITGIMWRNILGQVVYQLVVLGVLVFDGKKLLNLSDSDSTSTLNTFIFNTFVFCQVNFCNHHDVCCQITCLLWFHMSGIGNYSFRQVHTSIADAFEVFIYLFLS